MKIKRILSATLAAAMLMCCYALTACASKPAAPTAADFEVQPGEYRYQDVDIFFVETEKGNYYMNPSGDGLIHFRVLTQGAITQNPGWKDGLNF